MIILIQLLWSLQTAWAKTPIQSVAVGGTHSCVLFEGGRLKCWGNNINGQLGLGDLNNRGESSGQMGATLPFVDLGKDQLAVALALGTEHTCALLKDGTVKCWGDNQYGQLGSGENKNIGTDSDSMGDKLKPINLGKGRTAKQITAGYNHNCALLDNDSVKCWGRNFEGQLGLENTKNYGDTKMTIGDKLPVVKVGANVKVSQLSAGGDHTCAVLINGGLKCWGQNNQSELGLGDAQPRGSNKGEMGDKLPLVNVGKDKAVIAVYAGSDNTCALLGDGTYKCWGSNTFGALGTEDLINRGDTPETMGEGLVSIDLGLPQTQIVVGSNAVCGLLVNQTVKCWGLATVGQLGQEDDVSRGGQKGDMGENLPAVQLGPLAAVTQIAFGGYHACVVLGKDQLKCWGYNNDGQLGIGDTSYRGATPETMGENLPFVEL